MKIILLAYLLRVRGKMNCADEVGSTLTVAQLL